jgi:ceramide glucosyltransferase
MLALVWTAAAFTWWLVALLLLATARRRRSRAASAPSLRGSVSVFKSIPPIRTAAEREAFAEAIGSFVAQLQPQDELLLGLNVAEAPHWEPIVARWQATGRGLRVRMVVRERPRHCANPKIAWMQVLAVSAQGQLWLWSDADVTAPAGLINAICGDLNAGGGHAVTAAYTISRVGSARGLLDALFVNAEFLPGALLLGRLGSQNFAYGAATLFRADTFQARADWPQLGAALADDHKLGYLLQPVTLATPLVSTFTEPSSWREAWRHYYRWHKTVRWCRPGGYAALLLLLPALGWLWAATVTGLKLQALAALVGVLLGEALVGILACRLAGCRAPPAAWLGVLLWPLARLVTWLLVWLPLPVIWSGPHRAWSAPQQQQPP